MFTRIASEPRWRRSLSKGIGGAMSLEQTAPSRPGNRCTLLVGVSILKRASGLTPGSAPNRDDTRVKSSFARPHTGSTTSFLAASVESIEAA